MKKITIAPFEGYEFNELDENGKSKAISGHINFWLDCRRYDTKNRGNFEKAVDEADENRTPWFLSKYIFKYCAGEIIENINSAGYLFDREGNVIPIVGNNIQGSKYTRITDTIYADVIIEDCKI